MWNGTCAKISPNISIPEHVMVYSTTTSTLWLINPMKDPCRLNLYVICCGTCPNFILPIVWRKTSSLYDPHVTIASEIDHDVGLSVHEAIECERGDVAPHFEGPEEGVVDDFLVQIRSVSQDSVGLRAGRGIKTFSLTLWNIYTSNHETQG